MTFTWTLHAPLRSSTPVQLDSTMDSTANETDGAIETESCHSSSLASIHLSQLQSEDSHELTGSLELTPEQSVPTAPPASLLLNVHMSSSPSSINSGYKLVFDNIDKNITPRYMRTDNQTVSLHYVQIYVKDRVDFSSCSCQPPTECNMYSILPDSVSYESIKQEFTVIVSRMIHEHIAFFGDDFKRLVQQHIPHKYSAEMSKKSEVVPLGVLDENETSYEGMTKILEHMQKYIPSKLVDLKEPIPESEQKQERVFVSTLVGGDQLSTVRARGAQYIRSGSELAEDRVSGPLPVCEDWHAKVCLMETIWKRLYKPKSSMEKGTLYQLRNLINRRNVTTTPKSNVNASEDFLEVVVVGYIVAAVMAYLRMNSFEDLPDAGIVPHDLWFQDDSVRADALKRVAQHVVDEYVCLATEFREESGEDRGGTVYDYTCEVISLGLLYLNFKDAVREGDGDRVLRMWRYLMLIWKAMGHRNYAAEAFSLLSQYHLILPPNLAEQLKWSRFVNVHGLPGHNISCDLHMEHLNKVIKTAMEGLGANKKKKKAIQKAGRVVGVLNHLSHSFDREFGVTPPSGRHKRETIKKDLAKIAEALLSANDLFDCSTNTTHKSFNKVKKNVIKKLQEDSIKEWMIDRLRC